jgi:hypothetical protein
MTILNLTTDGLLPVFLSLHGALSAFERLTRDRLLEICAPTTVVPAGKPTMTRKTLTRWTQLGAIVERDGHLHLADSFARVPPTDLDGLRREVLRTLMMPDNNPFLEKKDVLGSADEDDKLEPEVEAEEESDETLKSGCSDFTRAVSWVMLQDPYTFDPAKFVQTQNEQGLKPRAIRNDSRWTGFAMWSAFTGVTFLTPGRMVLNPAVALGLALEEVFSDGARLSLDVFVARAAERLPFLDGGRFQRATVEGAEVPRPGVREISRCLSLALLHLQAEGSIKLFDVSDADRRILLGRGPQTSAYTHVERRKA